MNEGFEATRTEAILREAIMSTLADMAFLDASPIEAPPPSGKEVRAILDALKPSSCRVEIRATEGLRKKISGILFTEGEPTAAQDDTLLEILNIATGKFLTDYFGPDQEVKLELPRFLYFDEGGEGEVIASFGLDVEGDPLVVSLSSVRYRY